MVQNQLMCGLKRRYARTLGQINAGEDRGDDLAHLAAVIRMFSPGEDLSAIKPLRINRSHSRTWMRDALDVLRTANAPMTAWALARVIAAKRGVTERRVFKSISCSLHLTLDDLASVERVSENPKRWRIRPE